MVDFRSNIFESPLLDTLNDHEHKPQLIYPWLADPVVITKDAGVWAALSTPTEIMSSGDAPLDAFDIHWAIVSDVSTNGNFSLELYKGAAGAEESICRCSVFRDALVNNPNGQIKVQTGIFPPGTRISGALSSDQAGAESLSVKIAYHVYD